MLTHVAEWQRFHGPLIAFAVTLALALAGRFLRNSLLAAAAGGAGVVAGWFVLTGRLWPSPAGPSGDDLGAVAATALLVGLVGSWLAASRSAWIGLLLAALVAAWLFAGAPRHLSALQAHWPIAVAAGAAVLVFARSLAPSGLDPLRLALAGLTLAAAVLIVGAPSLWLQLALVPATAALATFALPSVPAAAALPVAVDLAATACLAGIMLGRLPRLGFGPVDAAALSPLIAVWLLPRTTERFGRLGVAAPLIGAVLAGAFAIGCVWLARLALPR